MKKQPLCKRVMRLLGYAVLLAGFPCFALVSPEQAGSALARMEYLRSSTPTKTSEQVKAEDEQAQTERNQRVLAEMNKPPVGFAAYSNDDGVAGVASPGGAGESAKSMILPNLLGILLLGIIFGVGGVMLRKKQPPPDEPTKSLPRKFSA